VLWSLAAEDEMLLAVSCTKSSKSNKGAFCSTDEEGRNVVILFFFRGDHQCQALKNLG
jgi:hypothetical protein